MMNLNSAYVTAMGKLIGVVGAKDLRKAIEDANNGLLPVEKDEEKAESLPLLMKKG